MGYPYSLRKAVTALLFAVAGLFGAVGPAQATLVVGSWDPPYGEPFPELGWRGSALFYIADDCKTNDGVRVVILNCGVADMQVKSAKVELYNINNPDATLQVLDFSSDMWVLAAHFDANGVIDGVAASTFFWALQPGLIPEAELSNGDPAYFKLVFDFDFQDGGTEAHLGYAIRQGGIIRGWNNGEQFPATVALQVVPEPASAALLLAALGAAGFAGRRSSQRQRAQALAADKA
jgi:hypothetical protein